MNQRKRWTVFAGNAGVNKRESVWPQLVASAGNKDQGLAFCPSRSYHISTEVLVQPYRFVLFFKNYLHIYNSVV